MKGNCRSETNRRKKGRKRRSLNPGQGEKKEREKEGWWGGCWGTGKVTFRGGAFTHF